ncbi:MAG: phenylalanine--tRNA ligase subunit beta [Cyanobacteria bacterium P01_D01_bin.73]
MHISLKWLRELIKFDLEAETLAETLTLAGFEVEDIEDRGTWADGVVVGYVKTREQHPNADRLSVCTVDVGQDEPLTIVCGAKNVAADQRVAVGTPGTYLPQIDLKLKPTKLRGVKSFGMICSLSELGLAKGSEGIYVFDDESLKPGDDVRPLLGLDDVILDLTSTANRADALSMVGVAREVAALLGGEVGLPQSGGDAELPQTGSAVKVGIAETQACPAYIGTVIEGVKIGPSPEWLQSKLDAAGVRPINNVVDVTNYVMLEWGQPLHAFDRDRLTTVAGDGPLDMGVRFAAAGEVLKTLDGTERNLTPQALVVTAGDKPVAMAGIMGGEETEVHDGTQALMLEAALFEPASVRRSGRSQGMRTEASTRYERGVNQVELDIAWKRAITLILEVAGGQVVDYAVGDTRPDASEFSHKISLRLDRVQKILGYVEDSGARDLRADEVERVLTALKCELAVADSGDGDGNGRVWTVTVPPYRYGDLTREIDLFEEVARLYGYNRFCSTALPKTELGFLPAEAQLVRKLRSICRGAGLTELIQYSLRKPEGDRQVAISNPLLAEYSALRTNLLDGLIEAFQYNWEKGNGGLLGFELGQIFWSDEAGLQEAETFGGIMGGDPSIGRWQRGGQEAPMTWYEAKGILEAIFAGLGLTVEYRADRSDDRLHPGRTALLWTRGDRLGTFGQLHPQLCQSRDLPSGVYIFQLDMEVIYKTLVTNARPNVHFKTFSTYPASTRDLAFFAPVTLSVADLERTMVKVGKPLLTQVELFDDYRGKGVDEGDRSLAFRLTYRSNDGTLTDKDVEPVHQKVRETLSEKFGVTLRS